MKPKKQKIDLDLFAADETTDKPKIINRAPTPRKVKPSAAPIVYANDLDKQRGELDLVTDKVIAERFSFNLMFRNTVAFSAFLKKIKPLIEKYGHEITD